MSLDRTHDPWRKSWVGDADAPDCDFPIQNLPFGVFSTAETSPRVGIAIGGWILDPARMGERRLITVPGDTVFNRPDVNAFMALGVAEWTRVRGELSDLREASGPRLRDDAELRRRSLVADEHGAIASVAVSRISMRPAGTPPMSTRCSATRGMR